MASEFTYLESTDFLYPKVNGGLLRSEILASSITIAVDSIDKLGDNVTVRFKTHINIVEEGILNSLVANHNGFLKQADETAVNVTLAEDETVKVTSNDQTKGFLASKIKALDSKVLVTTDDAGGSETLKVGVQPSNIQTTTLNNDAGFINSAGAPVQPSDIASFETSSQLTSRDTVNRNRSNHTGTQVAATISDFSAAVQASETPTFIGFNPTTSELSFTNEQGLTEIIDLSLFIDDTNLARITNGTLDSSTGIATFTRDDSTTFDVDFSSLNDQAFINNAINNHENTISNHNDVNTGGASNGDLLRYNGSVWVPFKEFKAFATFQTPRGTQSTSFQEYLKLNFTIPEIGQYKISWRYEWSYNNTKSDFEARVELNDNLELLFHKQEPQDSGGSGVTVQAIEGGTFNSGTDQRFNQSGFEIVTFNNTADNFVDLDLRCSNGGQEATIYRATLTIERWL